MNLDDVRFDAAGLVPVIVRNGVTGAVAMLAWANREAVLRTLATREGTFWSRSRKALWVKGAVSRLLSRIVRRDQTRTGTDDSPDGTSGLAPPPSCPESSLSGHFAVQRNGFV